MNDLNRSGGRGRSRGFLAAGLAVVMLVVFLSVAGGASAGNHTKTAGGSGSHGISAAQDQYGAKQVLKPPPPRVVAVIATKTPAATTPASTTTPPAAPTGTLPFTGLSLLKVVLLGIGLIVLGFIVRRRTSHSSDDK